MRITSLNLQGLLDWDHRSPRIVAALRRLDPDVVLFQEDVYLPDVSPWSPVAMLNRELRYPHRHESITRLQQGRVHPLYREGLGLLSKHPVVATEALVLRHEAEDPHERIVQVVDVAADDGTWPLVNVHLSVRDAFALEHLGELRRILAARGEQRILGGDFNVDHLERHRALLGQGVLTTEVASYESHPGTDETDDYFLVPPGWRIERVQVSADDLSDHRAITVDLERA
ncbi:endonuclease/exonuclease/phosphatase family protein [Amnibacterium endophyticum]|uniref:Endonuclease/exonuclease/phosphatase family protein n=1 Tax=Amnibacterium endophyticum TaxID=2109337 RepID=A0ABW4LFE9_9MICO